MEFGGGFKQFGIALFAGIDAGGEVIDKFSGEGWLGGFLEDDELFDGVELVIGGFGGIGVGFLGSGVKS